MMQEPPIERPVETASGPPPPLTDDPHATAEHLYDDLVARRTALHLPAPPRQPDEECSPVCAVDDPPGAPACAPPAGAACAATCAQAGSACDDASKLCAIAKQERTDATLAGRCHDAAATCAAATPACCGCN